MTLLRPAFVLLGLFTLLTGLAYPLAVTGLAQALFPSQANGSLILRNGTVLGSSLIGQNFSSDRYFQGRPSATSGAYPSDPSKTIEAPYNAAASTGSNLGPTSTALREAIQARAAALGVRLVPADLVTASASGLDPHISPAAASLQVARLAKARQLPEAQIQGLVDRFVEDRTFHLLGEPRINVLLLNLELDRMNP